MAKENAGILLSRLVELALRKKEIAEKILKLTSGQSGELTPENYDRLESLIKEKQDFMDCIDLIDDEALQLGNKVLETTGAGAWDDVKKIYTGEWEAIGGLRDEAARLLGEALVIDRRNLKSIGEEYRKLKSEMEQFRAGRGSAKAYQGNDAQTGGYFIDKKK